jgi:hypothetical protein
MDIRPMEVVETIKKLGIKFKRITRTFEHLAPSKTYKDYLNFENSATFGSVEIPKWFEAEKLIETFSQRSIQNYEQDSELKKAVEELKRTDRIGRPLLSFVQFGKNRFESARESYLEVEAQRFLRSNLPLSFYNKLVVFNNTYGDFLKILETQVRHAESMASYARSFDMYGKKIYELQKTIGPIIDKMDACFFQYTRLKKYVSIWNAKDYEEVIAPKYLDIKNLDFAEFGKLSLEYDDRLRETRAFLLTYDSTIFSPKISSQDPTAKMFGKLVMFPSGSLELQADLH